MFCGSPGFKTIIALAFVGLTLGLASCGSSSKATPAPSGLVFRAFISNPAFPNSAGSASPGIEVMDAQKDLLSNSIIPVSSAGSSVADAGLLVVSPKKDHTLLFSPSDSKLAVVSNSQE